VKALLVVMACAGCVAPRLAAWKVPEQASGDGRAEEAAGDRAFAEREQAARLDEAIAQYRAAARVCPGDARLWVKLSRATRLRAGDVRGAAGDRLALEAVASAERALATREELRRRAVDPRARPFRVFAAAERADVPALIAYADALFAWSERRSYATLLYEQDWIRGAAARAVALDRACEHGAPDRVLAVLESTLPTPEAPLVDALERFEAASAAAPGYLPTRVEFAERWAARMRDGRLYRRLLEEVAAADPDALADARPENRAAQRRARALLAE
jgi:hypothetical protein